MAVEFDLYYDPKTGIIYEKPKGGGKGVLGEPTGYNFGDLGKSEFSPPTQDQVRKTTTAVVVGIIIWEVFKWGAA